MPLMNRLGLLALFLATLAIVNSCGRTGMGGSSGRLQLVVGQYLAEG